jgi:hypothetical protein
MSYWLVAGKAKEMASVMDELMNHAAVNQGGGSLFGTHEVDQKQHQQTAEQSPRQQLPHWDYGDRNGLSN